MKSKKNSLLPKLPDGGRLTGESWEQYMRRKHSEEKDRKYTLLKTKQRDPDQPAWFDYDNAMSYDDRDRLVDLKKKAYMQLRYMNSHGGVNYENYGKSQFDKLAKEYKQIAAPYAGELLEQEGLPRAIGRYEDTYKNLEKRISPLEKEAMSVEKNGSYGTVKEVEGYGRFRSDGRTRIYEKPAIEKRPTASQFATDKLGSPVPIPEVRKGVPRDMSISYRSIFADGGMLNGIGQGILSGIGNAILPGIGGMLLPQLGNMLTKGKNPFKLYNDGGYLIQYSGPKHEKGGILVNQNGKKDDVNPIAEVEGGESGLKTKSGVYVFSDHLVNPVSGNTFSKDAKRINNKYKGTDRMAVNARKKEYSKLQLLNESVRTQTDSGLLPKFDPGGPLTSLTNPMNKYNPNLMPFGNGMPNISVLPTSNQSLTPNSNGLFSSTNLPYNKDGVITSNPGSIDVTAGRSNPLSQSTIGGLMKAGAYGMNLIDALRKPEREKLQLPDFGKGNRLVQGTGMSMEPMRQEINMQANKALDMAKSASGSFGQYMSRANSILGQSGKQLAESQLSQKQYNDQLALTKAGRQDQLSQLNQTERIRKQNADSGNIAMKQDMVANFYTNLNNLGTEFQKQDYLKSELANLNQKQKQDFMVKLATANAINPNFQLDKQALNKALTEDNLEGIMKAITFVKRNGGLIPKLK